MADRSGDATEDDATEDQADGEVADGDAPDVVEERVAADVTSEATPSRKKRSPLVLILAPLLLFVGVALGFRTLASSERADATAAVDAAIDAGSPVELCGGTDDELSLDGFSLEQPLVLSSLTLDRAAVSFVAPTEGGGAVEADDTGDDVDDDDQAMVDVIDLVLEKQSSGWCIASWDASTRLASS